MKKLLVLCSLIYVSACVYAGDVDVLGARNKWVESFQSYPVSYWTKEPKLVKRQMINEKSFKKDEIRTAFKGYSVLSDKTFERSYYVSEEMRANMNVVLSNASAPYKIKAQEVRKIIGTSVIDGVEYRLLPTELENYVILVAPNGEIWNKTGRIKDGRLVVLGQDFISSNPKFRFEPVFINTTTQTRPIKGFDIKYDGVRLDRMWFTYFDYATDTAGGFREYSFPKKPGLLTIDSVKLRVLDADNQRIDYMVLAD